MSHTYPPRGGATSRTYLNERIDSHDGHVGLTFSIVHQIEINEFLQLQVVRLHTVHHVGEEGAASKK